MSASRRSLAAFGFVLILIGLGAFAAIKAQDPKYAPKPVMTAEYVVHLKDPKCAMQAYLILGGNTQSNFDPNDETQRELWALAKKCNGWIEVKNVPEKAKRPARNG